MRKALFVLLALASFVFMSCDSDPYVVGYVSSSKDLIDALAKDKYGNEIKIKAGDYEFSDNLEISRDIAIDVDGDGAKLIFPEGKGIVATEKLGDGDLTISDIDIDGKLVINGGGSNSIHLENVKVAEVEVSKKEGEPPRLVIEGNTEIEQLNIISESIITVRTDETAPPIKKTEIADGGSVFLEGAPTTALGEIEEASRKNILTLWDGETIDETWYSESKDEFEIKTASQLAGLASLVNKGKDFSGKTIKLDTDIDLQGKAWIPIARGNRKEKPESAVFFKGTIDGQGHTIRNLSNKDYIENNTNEDEYAYGFIAKSYGATIKNLNFENVSIDVPNGNSVAGIVGYAYKNVTIENCNVSGFISGKDAVAGILGRAYGFGKDDNDAVFHVKNCINDASVISGGKAAGIVAITAETSGEKSSEVADCINNGKITCNGGGYSGGIIGQARYTNVKECINNGNITFTDNSAISAVGGIVGRFSLGGEITSCINNGSITSSNENKASTGIGGIAGWIHYENTYENKIMNCTIKNSRNNGNITTVANNGVGGIAGMIYWSAIIENCSNSGEIINETGNMTGGIVGGHQALDDNGYNANRDNKLHIIECVQDPEGKVESTGGNTHSVIGHIENPCKVPVDFSGTTPNDEYSGFKGVTGSESNT